MKKRLIVIVAIISLAVLGGAVYTWQKGSSSANKKTAMADVPTGDYGNVVIPAEDPFYNDISLSGISLDGDSNVYSLEYGQFYRNGVKISPESEKQTTDRLLRLALFYQWSKESPLLFGITINANNLRDSVARTKTTHDNLLSASLKNQSTAPLAGMTNVRFMPLNFLEKFAESTAKYAAFNKNISEQSAKELLAAIKEASGQYASDAGYFKHVLTELKKTPLGKRKIAFLGGETVGDFDVITKDYELIQKNSEALNGEIKKRELCLNLHPNFCRRPIGSELKQPEIQIKPPGQTAKAGLFTDKELVKSAAQYTGPYEIHSLCWRKTDTHYIYRAQRCQSDQSYCYDWSLLADEIYFVKLWEKDPLQKKMLDEGMQVLYQSATAPYECNDLEYKPALETVDYFYANYKNDRLYLKLAGDNFTGEAKTIIGDGQKIESMFFDAKYPSDHDLEKLGDHYAYFYAYLSKNLPERKETREELLKRYVLIKEKMIGFDLILNRLGLQLDNLRKKVILQNRGADFPFLIVTRNSYSLIFLNFSPYAWLYDKKPDYFISGYSIEPDEVRPNYDSIMNYEKAVEKYGREHLEKWKYKMGAIGHAIPDVPDQ